MSKSKKMSKLVDIIADVKTDDDKRRVVLAISELLKVSRASHYTDKD
jgi:hypothetical protein